MSLLLRASRRLTSWPGRWRGLLVWLAAALAAPSWAQETTPNEYELKAAFIYRIAAYVDWPTRAEPGPVLRVCVFGGNPFGPALESIRGKAVGNRRLEVRFVEGQAALRECQMVFVAAAAERQVERLAALAQEQGSFLMGDSEGLAERGAMLNFFVDRDRVRFEINLEAARRAGFKISSKVLSLARIVDAPAAPSPR